MPRQLSQGPELIDRYARLVQKEIEQANRERGKGRTMEVVDPLAPVMALAANENTPEPVGWGGV